MQDNKEERNISQALGSIPKVNNQRAFSCTVTVAGTGLGDITVDDVRTALDAQHDIASGNLDQLYVHEMRAYGTAGGYLSIAPYPHRQYLNNIIDTGSDSPIWINYYQYFTDTQNNFRAGSLTQMYEFGINGATRPELVWKYPKDEIINNPFTLQADILNLEDGATVGTRAVNTCKLLTIQSTNVNGDALYIVQFDVTVRRSNFIEITPALGAAAFGEKNVITDNYKPPVDLKKRLEEGKKAQEMANKKRKVESVKALTMPALDAH